MEAYKKTLEKTIYGVGTRKSAAGKDEAAQVHAAIPKEVELFEWARKMACREDAKDDSAGSRSGLEPSK